MQTILAAAIIAAGERQGHCEHGRACRTLKDRGAKLARFWVFGDGRCWTYRGWNSVDLDRNEINNFMAMVNEAEKLDIKVRCAPCGLPFLAS